MSKNVNINFIQSLRRNETKTHKGKNQLMHHETLHSRKGKNQPTHLKTAFTIAKGKIILRAKKCNLQVTKDTRHKDKEKSSRSATKAFTMVRGTKTATKQWQDLCYEVRHNCHKVALTTFTMLRPLLLGKAQGLSRSGINTLLQSGGTIIDSGTIKAFLEFTKEGQAQALHNWRLCSATPLVQRVRSYKIVAEPHPNAYVLQGIDGKVLACTINTEVLKSFIINVVVIAVTLSLAILHLLLMLLSCHFYSAHCACLSTTNIMLFLYIILVSYVLWCLL